MTRFQRWFPFLTKVIVHEYAWGFGGCTFVSSYHWEKCLAVFPEEELNERGIFHDPRLPSVTYEVKWVWQS